jgi:ubiquinone biosynthesis protein
MPLLTPRHLNRYRQIAEIMISHGFGAIVTQLGLARRLDLPRRLFRRQEVRPDEITPAEHVRLALEELGPTFVKLGQILSTRPDLLPPSYLTELARLQDQVPPMPWESVQSCIENELGLPVEEIFATFNKTPLAAASLAQVHVATLPGGQEVVVKVQRLNVEKSINLDLDILYDFARLAQERTPLSDTYDLVGLAEEFSVALKSELDYRREGRNADRFRANFAKESYLYVPRVYWDYSTRRVLVQERISGIKIDDVEALDAAGYDRHNLALTSAHIIIKEVFEDGFFHADPHPGNLLVMPDEVIGVMDFGTVGYMSRQDRAGLMRLFIVAVQLDAAGIVDQLVRMGVADYRPNREALQRDVRRLLVKYHGQALTDISAPELLEEIRPIAYRHHLRLPSDLWLLAKTLVIMEGVGKKLDPEFDIFAVAETHMRRLLWRMWLPTEWGPSVLNTATSWGDLLTNFPRQTNRILSQMEQGDLGLQIHVPELSPTINRLDRIATRIVLGVLLAAMIVALAMLIPVLDLTWPWSLITWIIVTSFMVMIFLGLWLVVSILRSGGDF